jgi:probable phosphoglycerate mutase
MPDGWSPRPENIIANWKDFLTRCETEFKNKTILVVTSNGIARFVLNLAQNGDTCPLKLSTGAYGILKYDTNWTVTDWNIRP